MSGPVADRSRPQRRTAFSTEQREALQRIKAGRDASATTPSHDAEPSPQPPDTVTAIADATKLHAAWSLLASAGALCLLAGLDTPPLLLLSIGTFVVVVNALALTLNHYFQAGRPWAKNLLTVLAVLGLDFQTLVLLSKPATQLYFVQVLQARRRVRETR